MKPLLPLLAIPALAVYAIANIGNWLAVQSPPAPNAHAVFLFAGEPQRTAYALELARTYKNATLVCSEYNALWIRQQQANDTTGDNDAVKIHITEPCAGTIDEVRRLRKYLDSTQMNRRTNDKR